LKKHLKSLGIIPARAGSKSIPHKNTVFFGGKRLVEWVIEAGKESKLNALMCSTDDYFVKEICDKHNIKDFDRPVMLRGDDVPIIDVIRNIFTSFHTNYSFDIMFLLQPTSPFVTPEQINHCIDLFETDPSINSIQTVTEVPHNFHAHNQRKLDEKGNVSFVFPEERESQYNKQRKPKHFMFANLVATRVSALDNGLFAEPSCGVEVKMEYALDIESYRDIELGEWYLREGKVYGVFKEDRFGYWDKEGDVDWSGPAMLDSCRGGGCSLR
jgi:CMP-N,N'-diacetyllegionaminic acid synthase